MAQMVALVGQPDYAIANVCDPLSSERELSAFIASGEQAGLKFEKLWDLIEGPIIEFRLR